jgi:hypothetical protein
MIHYADLKCLAKRVAIRKAAQSLNLSVGERIL